MRFGCKSVFIFVVAASATFSAAQAQWSIGAPGTREAPAGKHRYAYLVFANPIPGRAAEFNDWYTNANMVVLVQLTGWTATHRFRIVTHVPPPPTTSGYRHGGLMIWDLEAADANG